MKIFHGLNKRKKVILLISGLFVLILAGLLIFASRTGRLSFFAATGSQISNMATATYTDPSGNTVTVNSNTVTTEVIPTSDTLNINIALQSRTNLTTTNVSLKVYNAGTTTLVFEKNDISTDASGNAAIAVTGLVPGTKYDYLLKVPYFLSKKILDTAFDTSATVSFGSLLTGDLNNNNVIDMPDYIIFHGKWDTSDSLADFNQNGKVDMPDYIIFRPNWQKSGN